MKAILLTDKRSGEKALYGSFAAIFENYDEAQLGISYKQLTMGGNVTNFETQNFKIQVFAEIIKSRRKQQAGRETAERRGLCK